MSENRSDLGAPGGVFEREVSRRRIMGAALLGAAALPMSSLLAACGANDGHKNGGRGGTLRLAAIGTGAGETLKPGIMNSTAEIARAYQCYEPLATISSVTNRVEPVLAEELVPNSDASVWTVRLRKDVTWHDGKPLTADDVIYTIRYHVKLVDYAGTVYRDIDVKNLKKVDAKTVSIPLNQSNFLFDQILSDLNALIIQDGTTDFSHPVGTGPFKFKSFTVGQQATYVRNPDYWNGPPALDAVQILSIDDNTARINALLSGQVDAVSGVPATAVSQLKSGGARVLSNHSGNWMGIRLRVSLPPFNDPNARQAMKLLINRDEVVNNAMDGYAKVGNDLFGWFDPYYATDLPQREYDPEQAKSLLAKAGLAGATLSLPTTEIVPGTNAICTLFANSAAAGGMTIKVVQKTTADFWGVPPAKESWAPTAWNATPIVGQISHGLASSAASETTWSNSQFDRAFQAAIGSSDPAKQKDYLIEAQRILYDDGPYIIPAFQDNISATSKRVSGVPTNSLGIEFGNFDFRKATLS